MKFKVHYNESVLFFLFACFLIASCETKESSSEHNETSSESEWVNLLDDNHKEYWTGTNAGELPPGWKVEDEMLWFDPEFVEATKVYDYGGGKNVIYKEDEFEFFELTVDWKIPAGGNSGIFYHVDENSSITNSPEYQLIDDENFDQLHDLTEYNKQFGAEEPSKLQDWQKTGADYAMHVPDESKKKLNPTGEWNTSRIVVAPNSTEHWLNGEKLLTFKPWSDDWNEKKNSGKWDEMPDYGLNKTGYIALQDHGSQLWFKNIKLKEIKN